MPAKESKQVSTGRRRRASSYDASSKSAFTPHSHQKIVWDSEAKVVAAISGHGGGKSHLGPPWLFREAGRHPGKDFLVCGPTLKMLRKSAIPKLEDFCRIQGLTWDYDSHTGLGFRSGYLEYAMPQGGTIYFVTAERPGSMQGVHAQGFWMDETVDTDFYVYETLIGRVALNAGRGLITSTPYDMGWFYTDIYLKWKEGSAKFQKDQIFCHQWRSIDNPAYPVAEFNRLRETLPPWRFRMLYEGQFERPEGLVYDCFSEFHYVEPFNADAYIGSKVVLGIDWGFQDPMAAIWLAKMPNNKVYAVEEYYKSGWMAYENIPGRKQDRLKGGSMEMPTEMLDEIVARCVEKHLIPEAVYCDPSQPAMVEYARRKFAEIGVYKVFGADNAILPGISKAYGLVRTGDFFVCNTLINFKDEQEKYAWDIDKQTGELKKSGIPVDKHNHAMDAWRYAMAGSKEEPTNSFGVGSISAFPTPFSGRNEFERLYRR